MPSTQQRKKNLEILCPLRMSNFVTTHVVKTEKKVAVSENGIDNENIACVKVLVKKI